MIKIKLNTTKGNHYALIDECDFDIVNKYNWFLHSCGYAVANTGGRKNRKQIYLHRLILEAKGGEEVDHINRDTLDNRRENIRIATRSQNAMNRGLQSNNNSGYSGISKRGDKWRARIKVNNKEIHIGIFNNIQDAIKNRKLFELKYFKEYA